MSQSQAIKGMKSHACFHNILAMKKKKKCSSEIETHNTFVCNRLCRKRRLHFTGVIRLLPKNVKHQQEISCWKAV